MQLRSRLSADFQGPDRSNRTYGQYRFERCDRIYRPDWTNRSVKWGNRSNRFNGSNGPDWSNWS